MESDEENSENERKEKDPGEDNSRNISESRQLSIDQKYELDIIYQGLIAELGKYKITKITADGLWCEYVRYKDDLEIRSAILALLIYTNNTKILPKNEIARFLIKDLHQNTNPIVFRNATLIYDHWKPKRASLPINIHRGVLTSSLLTRDEFFEKERALKVLKYEKE